MQHPIDNIEWQPADRLDANAWNPNHVLSPEFKLLKMSLLKQGWIQPILVARNEKTDRLTIIDGFHRATLAKSDKQVAALSDGKVPCTVLDISVAEAKMLTVRINRAKGSHSAHRMHELVTSLATEHGLDVKEIAAGIGATKHEVDTLLTEDLFKKFDVDNTPYSKAWMPKEKKS